MANLVTLTNKRQLKEDMRREYSIKLSGNYVQVTGEVLDLTSVNATAAQNPNKVFRAIPGAIPSQEDIEVTYSPAGYDATVQVNAVPSLKTLFLRIYTTAATELGAGGYAAGLLADNIRFRITQKKKYG